MGLFKFSSKKSSSDADAPRVTSEMLYDKVNALRGELYDLGGKWRGISDRQDAFHERLEDLENILVDLESEVTLVFRPND